MNTLTCPKCHGNKLTQLPDGSYKCAYCGNVFRVQPEKPETESVAPAPPKPIVVNVQVPNQPQEQGPRAISKGKSKAVAAILALVFGELGIHWFYLGKNTRGLVYLLACLLLCWTIVVPVILAVIAFIEFIWLIFMSSDTFNSRYNTYYVNN